MSNVKQWTGSTSLYLRFFTSLSIKPMDMISNYLLIILTAILAIARVLNTTQIDNRDLFTIVKNAVYWTRLV
jgi:hypothetical protein